MNNNSDTQSVRLNHKMQKLTTKHSRERKTEKLRARLLTLHMQTNTQTHRHTDRQTDRQTFPGHTFPPFHSAGCTWKSLKEAVGNTVICLKKEKHIYNVQGKSKYTLESRGCIFVLELPPFPS